MTPDARHACAMQYYWPINFETLQAIAKEQKALVRWAFNITRHLFRRAGCEVMYHTRLRRYQPNGRVLWPHQHAKLSQPAAGNRRQGP